MKFLRSSSFLILILLVSLLSIVVFSAFYRGKPEIIAVVVENHEDAREYHAGLDDALMIQEFLVEGFISRFIVLFSAMSLPSDVGPIRSLRPYLIDGVLPHAGTIFHAGGSPEALERTEKGNEVFAINGLYDDEIYFKRKEEAPAPHDLFLKRSAIRDLLSQVPAEYRIKSEWPPYTIGRVMEGEAATRIDVTFFNPLHDVLFAYHPLSRSYVRANGNTVSDAHPRNVLILEVPIDFIGEYGRLFMDLTGEGRALLFQGGVVQEGRFRRSSLEENVTFETDDGEAMRFSKGQTWMIVLPDLARVTWE